MIKLKNIKIDNNIIECDIYPEDSNEKGYIKINKKTKNIVDYLLPKGYEWCKNHLNHAKNYLISDNIDSLNEKIIMWY